MKSSTKCLFRLLACLAALSPLQAAGLVVLRAEKGLQFADAVAVTVNGKDKVLNLGTSPKLTEPIGKLPSIHLNGTMVQDADAGVIALYEHGVVTYIVPEGTPKNGPSDPAGIWKASRLAYKKSQNDKTPAEIGATDLVAYLPDGVDGLARFSTDERAMRMTGGKDKAFTAQLDLLAAAVKAYGSDPAMAPVEKYVAQSMQRRYEQFENGAGGLDALVEGLRLAELSQANYPSAPGHDALRKALVQRKQWLDRKVAVLRAFNAAEEWDAFLMGCRDFDRYQHAYPEMAALETAALKQSLRVHQLAGEERQKEGDFSAAYREFRVASLRQPSDSVLQQKITMAWTDYSRQLAVDHQRNRKQLSAGQREAIDQNLAFATRYKGEDKLDRAMEEVGKAEAIDPESLAVLLKKAEILAAQHEYVKALAALDQYDRFAIDEERRPSSQLRNSLLFERSASIEKLKAEFQTAWAAGNFHKARNVAVMALLLKDDDPDVLLNAGMASQVVRDGKSASDFLRRYLEVSNTLDAKPEQREKARRVLAVAGPPAAPEEGDANWLSGKKLPKGVFYCPISLAFQPRVERINAGNLRVTYEWAGDRLKSVVPAFEKAEKATGEKRISFSYDARVPVVVTAAYGDTPQQLPADPDERLRGASQVLLNYPDADPAAIQALTGKNVAIGISGNRYFQPFVWDKIHYFRLTYDGQGRVAQARELADLGGLPTDQWLEFEWSGLQLLAIRGYQGTDERQRVKVYERTMQYQNGRLMSEEMRHQDKTSRIKYTYNANGLVSAECDHDPTLDDRGRQVTFLAGSPTVQIR